MAEYQLTLLGQQVQSALDQVATNTSAIGDLADLETTDKDNLVAAINEAAQSGTGITILTKTVTGTTDENAFISTGLKSNDCAVLGATDLYVNGTLYNPFFAIPLYRGTSDGLTTSLKLLTWARTDDELKNVSVSLKIYYIAY